MCLSRSFYLNCLLIKSMGNVFRVNDVAMAVRILEAVKEKGAGSKEIYNYILKEIKPTMDELGLPTPEELGIA